MHGSDEVKIDAKEYVRIGEQYAKAFREAFPGPTVVSTTCARCHATLPEMTEATVDAVVAAHQERCFVVGDCVRWVGRDGDQKTDGQLVSMSDGLAEIRTSKGSMGCFVQNLRRLQRPKHGPGGSGLRGPCDADCAKCEAERTGKIEYWSSATGEDWALVGIPQWQPSTSYLSAPRSITVTVGASNAQSPVLYDGLTAEQCLTLYERSQREDMTILSSWDPPLSANQLAAARALWSAQLRAKVAASAEADRLTVLVDDQSEP